jgi:hypothetical protein
MDDLSRTLGAIEAKLDMVTKTLAEDRVASAQYRTDMRRDLTELRDSVGDLKNRVNNNADELAELHPVISSHQLILDDYRLKVAQGVGVWNTAKTIWAALTALGGAGIGYLIHLFWPPKH